MTVGKQTVDLDFSGKFPNKVCRNWTPVMKVVRTVLVLRPVLRPFSKALVLVNAVLVLALAKTVLVLTICGLGLDYLVWS